MTAIVSRFPDSARVRTVPRAGPKNRVKQIRFIAGLVALAASACFPIALFLLAWNAATRGALPQMPQHIESSR